MASYYNEIDPFAAQWIRNLIKKGTITDGEVDERSIVDVRPDDLLGFERCHFFAGIGVWDYALQIACWPDGRPVWTGSCPCQPFSAAGRRLGVNDERHLWPVWFDLIRECGPPTVFGEQVEAAVRLGWLDAVFSDLEGEDYACGAAVLGAHSVGAPHIRQRLWFVGNSKRIGVRGQGCRQDAREERGVPHTNRERKRVRDEPRSAGAVGTMGIAAGVGRQRIGAEPTYVEPLQAGANSSAWADLEWLPCRDGKARPTQPGLQPLAHGATSRVGRLRAYGNAIVPQVAAEFIRAALEVRP